MAMSNEGMDANSSSPTAPKSALRAPKYTSYSDLPETAAMEADKTLFNTMNIDITNHLASCIDSAIDQGVSTLPALDLNKQQVMKKLLHRKFMRNVRIFETYCDCNIFTLRKHAPSRVEEVLRLHQELKEGCIPELLELPELDENHDDEQLDFPSSCNVPTSEQVTALEQEILDMRRQYALIVEQRAALEQATKDWEAAQDLASFASASLQKVLSDAPSQIVQPVARVVEQQPRLIDSIHHGQALLEELSTKRSTSATDTDGVYLLGQFKKPKTTLEERLREMTKVCTDDENEASALLALLTGPKAAATKGTTPSRLGRTPGKMTTPFGNANRTPNAMET
ncbi:hypothetical protein MPSEU_000844200 [Mayamaea pseudoterrestris]|nr:hypothetical protein MPSEU_000844200 [Mayamaea pseudoterrestris]